MVVAARAQSGEVRSDASGAGSGARAPWPAAEFFAGIGLVRMAIEREGFRVVFANDHSAVKRRLYAANFDAAHYTLADIRSLAGRDIPDVALATASFPCTDLSLAGARAGLGGAESGAFWEFARLLDELAGRRPPVILLENVGGFSSSRNGADLRAAILRLNALGYWCDVFVLDARHFVPQSRPRLFIVGSLGGSPSAGPRQPPSTPEKLAPDSLHPSWLRRFTAANPDLRLGALLLAPPAPAATTLANVVERLPPDDGRWWDAERVRAVRRSLSPLNAARVQALQEQPGPTWRTAYRRTRRGAPMWEVRRDGISGCLRTARGGSSRQALIEAGGGALRARWMTPREYARLMGAPDYRFDSATPLQALFGFGDAVCVPAVQWIARECLAPLVRATYGDARAETAG